MVSGAAVPCLYLEDGQPWLQPSPQTWKQSCPIKSEASASKASATSKFPPRLLTLRPCGFQPLQFGVISYIVMGECYVIETSQHGEHGLGRQVRGTVHTNLVFLDKLLTVSDFIFSSLTVPTSDISRIGSVWCQ
jgi:hypothetical protein